MTGIAPRWIGQGIAQTDMRDKLTGAADYVGDLTVPRMLHAAIVRSEVAHGIIRSIDTSRAERVPGVRAVLTGADTPSIPFGPYVPDWRILAEDKVRYIGDEIAAIAATSPEAAREAAALIEVDIEPLPAVFDPFEALAPDTPPIWDERPDNVANAFAIDRGDLEAGWAAADLVVEGEFTTNRIYHGYLEPIGVLAEAHPNGRYTLTVPTHIPYKARITYASALGIPLDHIRMVVPPIGGSFGAKYEMLEPLIVACLSRAAGAPVRLVYDREEDAAIARPRPPFHFQHRIGVTAEGRFVARETEVTGIAGARVFWSPAILATAVHRVDSLYHFGSMQGSGRLAYTNEPPTTAMRGFGNAEALFGIEQLIDEIAERLDHDPIELRRRNAAKAGERTMHGWLISSSELPACLDRARELSGYPQRRALVEGTRGRTGIRRGMGMAIAHHVSGYKPILKDFDGSSAIVRLGGDGRVSLFVGEPDLGQGQVTILSQIVAEGLGCAPNDVQVQGVDSAMSPDAVGTLASRATTMAGMAAVEATRAARERLTAFIASGWQVDASELEWDGPKVTHAVSGRSSTLADAAHDYQVVHCGLPLLGEGVHRPDTEDLDAEKYGNPSVAYPFAAHVAEVEVDCDTGQARVIGYWAVHDSGTILNPSTARSQVLGAIAQGVGWSLMEDVDIVDGAVRNPSFLDYRIPGAGDMPARTVVEFVEGYEPNGPHGAKSLAEAAINPTIAAVANAIHDATGVRPRHVPIAPERLWEALQEDAS
ncbi:MAG: xanthine dehydrogenase family protein molybdopterin-binding subunit [Nitriliruptoraceae bacterium]|nr:xanthine dehydrogenase family protein molybdopterin-binding subunit [Nitriliruptoraceae bacterium]